MNRLPPTRTVSSATAGESSASEAARSPMVERTQPPKNVEYSCAARVNRSWAPRERPKTFTTAMPSTNSTVLVLIAAIAWSNGPSCAPTAARLRA